MGGDAESEKGPLADYNQYAGLSPKHLRVDLPPELTAEDSVHDDKPRSSQYCLPTIFYITIWMALSTGVVFFNKWVIFDKGFHYPILLTTWHMVFAAIMTQLMSVTSQLRRSEVKMNALVYCQAIVPIGVAFSGSLICSNFAYLYLTVAFSQMLKVSRNAEKLS